MNTSITDEQRKQLVREKYGEIADQEREQNASSCCGSGCCSSIDVAILAEDYSPLEGYNPEADLGLGCGLPTEFALIKKGDTVIDLGSGAGNDCFVARSLAGETGKVIGVDFTERMIEKARKNAEKLQYNNIEFRQGDIEDLPVSDDTADVVVSNCVLNLVPNKRQAFAETYRVLKPGAHFSVSDIVLEGDLPEALREAAEMYVGCISGAVQKKEYIHMIEATGFTNVRILKEKAVTIPDDILATHLTDSALNAYKESGTAIFSITVYGEKPGEKSIKNTNKTAKEACCEPGCCGN